jgi:hypothetical protein
MDAPLRAEYRYERQRLTHLKQKLKASTQRATTQTLRRFRNRASKMREKMRQELGVKSTVDRFARAEQVMCACACECSRRASALDALVGIPACSSNNLAS